jgi:hypothetical protein
MSECDAIEKNEVDSVPYYLGNGNTLQVHWESVPEPSALVLLAIGAINSLAFGWCRKRMK